MFKWSFGALLEVLAAAGPPCGPSYTGFGPLVRILMDSRQGMGTGMLRLYHNSSSFRVSGILSLLLLPLRQSACGFSALSALCSMCSEVEGSGLLCRNTDSPEKTACFAKSQEAPDKPDSLFSGFWFCDPKACLQCLRELTKRGLLGT